MKHLDVRLTMIVLGVSLGMLLGPGIFTAHAHGGGVPQLVNAEAGPYWVSVWTQPDPLQVGQVHVTVAVSEPTTTGKSQREAGAPILDAIVQVQFQPVMGNGQPQTVPATHEGATNKLLYETDLSLVEAGLWQVSVTVDGAQGLGRTSFQVEVSEASHSRWPWIGGLAVVGLGVLLVVQQARGKRDKFRR